MNISDISTDSQVEFVTNLNDEQSMFAVGDGISTTPSRPLNGPPTLLDNAEPRPPTVSTISYPWLNDGTESAVSPELATTEPTVNLN